MSSGNCSPSRRIFMLGATHHRVPIEVRERLALGKEGAELMRAELAAMPDLHEFVVLSTCNRIEFYGVHSAPAVVDCIQSSFCKRQRFAEDVFADFALRLEDATAIQHLLEVASGLDSQMLGETEIFGQVKDAYSLAQEQGSTRLILNRIFQKAFQAAKQVRTETAISIGQVSVANVAVDLALDIFGRLRDTKVLLMGAGEIGEKTAQAFKSRGASSLTVASRRFERAVELAEALGAAALPFDQCEERLHEYDVVVCATSAPGIILSSAAVRTTMRRRPARPLLCLDLALPRDIDAAVGDCESVYLYNLDDLAKVADQNRRAREAEVIKAKALLVKKSEQLLEAVQQRMNEKQSSE